MAVLVSCLAVAGCAQDRAQEHAENVDVPRSITVTSPVLEDGKPVPERFTCDGLGVSPALAWDGLPADTETAALVVDDPDAPGGTFVHWVVLDIPRDVMSLPTSDVPAGAIQATNSAGDAAYMGPCPPDGTHRYRFTVYAMSSRSGLSAGADLDDALSVIERKALAQGRLLATYTR